jgi:SAM-dependent methyltransferase
MHQGLAPSPPAPAQAARLNKLRRFVQAYWLRPENAFWMTLRSETLAQCRLAHPSIDLGCGDGVFAFLHCGGVFDPDFDVFKAVGDLDRVRDEHLDMFDHVTESYEPQIVSPAEDRIDVGADLKAAMLAKAERLNIYDRLVEHDNNRPLPFGDDSFETVYCNAAYWVANIDTFLSEIARITRPGGRIILQVKLDSMRRYTLDAHRSVLGDRFLDIIGRGRLDTWPSLADRAPWEARFAAAGLSIQSAMPFVTGTHAHVWDIGLRPVAPMLVKMANALEPRTRASIKRDWVDLFCDLLEPLCDPNFNLTPGKSDPAEMQYLLTPA